METLKVILYMIAATGLGYSGCLAFRIIQDIVKEEKYKFDDEEERERFEFEQRKGDITLAVPVRREGRQKTAVRADAADDPSAGSA